uniref:Protein kinase domain-containing protein n=1 Tax=Maylandia zebra TaxID=106582 RepID=A0A3P9DII4_9CICH
MVSDSSSSSYHSDEGLQTNALIQSKTCKYMVYKLLGQGSFGRVVECVKLDTFERVAVKAAKREYNKFAWNEAAAVKELSVLDRDRCNLVKYYEVFEYKHRTFISMEMLDISLHDFVTKRSRGPLALCDIRVILKQMFVALTALKSRGMMHADIKPDNIMLVNQSQQPYKVKLIDFGFATSPAKIPPGTIIQALSYRAPEVMLGIPVTEAADMWTLGCVAAFLYLGHHLFFSRCEYQMMQTFVHMLGQPNKRMLQEGRYSTKYFWMRKGIIERTWVLKTPAQYSASTGTVIKQTKHHPQPNTESEVEDTAAFLSLLKWMLCVDPVKRITPVEGLGHRFITMKHLPEDPAVDCYTKSSCTSMEVCPLLSLENEIDSFVTTSEIKRNSEQSGGRSRRASTFNNCVKTAKIQRNRQRRAAARKKNQPAFRRWAWQEEDDMSCRLGVKQKLVIQIPLVGSYSESSDLDSSTERNPQPPSPAPQAAPPAVASGSSPRVGTPSDGPLPTPEPFSGESDKCAGFLAQVSLTFRELQRFHSNDGAKITYLVQLLRGRALKWAQVVLNSDLR